MLKCYLTLTIAVLANVGLNISTAYAQTSHCENLFRNTDSIVEMQQFEKFYKEIVAPGGIKKTGYGAYDFKKTHDGIEEAMGACPSEFKAVFDGLLDGGTFTNFELNSGVIEDSPSFTTMDDDMMRVALSLAGKGDARALKAIYAELDRRVNEDGNGAAAQVISYALGELDTEFIDDFRKPLFEKSASVALATLKPKFDVIVNNKVYELNEVALWYGEKAAILGHPDSIYLLPVHSSPRLDWDVEKNAYEAVITSYESDPSSVGLKAYRSSLLGLGQAYSSYYRRSVRRPAPEVDDIKAVDYLSREPRLVLGFELLASHYSFGLGTNVDNERAARLVLFFFLSGFGEYSLVADGRFFKENLSRDTLTELQKLMKEMGYYKSTIDGIVGPGMLSGLEKIVEECDAESPPVGDNCLEMGF